MQLSLGAHETIQGAPSRGLFTCNLVNAQFLQSYSGVGNFQPSLKVFLIGSGQHTAVVVHSLFRCDLLAGFKGAFEDALIAEWGSVSLFNGNDAPGGFNSIAAKCFNVVWLVPASRY